MGELAMRAVHGTPPLGDVEDHVDLRGQERMHRMPARRLVDSACRVAAPGPPAVHPVVGDLPQRARPAVGEPGRDGVVDGLQDSSLTSAGTLAGSGPLSPNRIFPGRPPTRWPAP